jgi:hypothetical protein
MDRGRFVETSGSETTADLRSGSLIDTRSVGAFLQNAIAGAGPSPLLAALGWHQDATEEV